jgi:hypothetical protein
MFVDQGNQVEMVEYEGGLTFSSLSVIHLYRRHYHSYLLYFQVPLIILALLMESEELL